MRRTVSIGIFLSIMSVSPSTFAETSAKGGGPEIIRFTMGDLVLPFKHWSHQKSLNGSCSPCHGSEPGKIANWSKDTAHTFCISCHEKMNKGPTECKQCHVSHFSRK